MARSGDSGRRSGSLLLSLLLAVGMIGISAPAAWAADPTASISIQKSANTDVVEPGQTFDYTIQVQCTSGAVNGCVNAQVTDQLPEYISLNGAVTVAGSTTNPAVDEGPPIVVTFNDDLGGGQTGLAPGNVIVVTIPVVVDDDIPPDVNGTDLVNTATITADNAIEKSDSATVTPDVAVTLGAVTTKSIDPEGAPPNPGTPLTAALTGQNTSNVPVDTLVIADPADPAATPNPFENIGIVDPPADVTMPAGAETVQVSLYVNGAWVDGPSGPPQPVYPAGVDPAEATGIRWTFASTDGADIPVGATAGAGINMEQRDTVAGLTDPIVITNDANTTVTVGEDAATSPPASDTYRIPPSIIDVVAGKTFDPDTVHAGDPSTVTLTGTNNSEGQLTSLTIVEPASGTPNHFTDGGFTYTPGTDNVAFPSGATAGTVTFECAGAPGAPQPLTDGSPLPQPPDDCLVTGFTVQFTGSIAAGATATVPFDVTTDGTQTTEETNRDNTVSVDAANEVTTATDQASDSITSIVDRIQVEATKKILPSTIPAWPGEIVTAELSGRVLPFPESTVPATTIVVQDPATIPDPNQWYDSFNPAGVVATPVPACATASVFYTVDGSTWLPVPGMQDVPPGIYNAPFPDDVDENAIGIQFVYTADEGGNGCSGGFPPGTSVAPNISYSLEADVPNEDATFTDCAASSATSPTVTATSSQACDSIDVTPWGPGLVNPIDKAWDVDLLNARSQEQAGATISWSTAGFTGIGRAQATDIIDPAATALPASAFDIFNLVRIDAVTPDTNPRTGDPWLTYDQVQSIELYELPVGSTNPATGQWVTVGPCPAACDGKFPGYTLTEAERAVTIGFRLNYIESPTRAERLSAGAPPVGSGVAASTGNDRHLHPVFQLRDDLRSDPDIPITADRRYNTATAGVIENTVRADPFRDPDDTTPIDTFTADDTIALVDVPVTADATKSWNGGPLGIPDPDVPQEQWPTARVTLTGTNTTPAKVDELVIADPTGGATPFDAFNLAGFVSITSPGDIGASDLVVTLSRGAAQTTYTRDQALALTEADLVDVTGFEFDYTGRINAGTANPPPTATIVFDTRLRTQSRSTGQPPAPGTTITNTATTTVSDLVDYPDVEPRTQDATATDDIQLVAQGIDVVAGKTLNPATLTEPAAGPVTVSISGQPVAPGGGALPPSRAVQLVLTDSSPTFWNAYDLVALNPVTFTTPVDQVRVDAYTGGTWSVVAGLPVLTGGSWQLGEPTTDPNVSLPGAVTTPDQAQALRYTFTRSDGANWENPADPLQTATFQVQRRDTRNTGGPVLPDLADNPPAPGEAAPGVTTNTVTADVASSDVDANGDPLTATDDADAAITYRHATNGVTVTKVGNGGSEPVSPGADFSYRLTVTNSGDVDIVDPVITDRLPSDADGPQVLLADDPRFSYAISGGTGLPTDPDLITLTATPDPATAAALRWTFPAGSTLPVGASYTITFFVKTRPGVAANTVLTNGFGVTGGRPWDECANGGGNEVDPDTGECATDTTNSVLTAAAISVNKQVKAQGSDQLGVVLDPLAVTSPTCAANDAGFYRRPCIPIAQPGGTVTWRWEFVNVGNRPLDRILGIDRLPQPGDAVAIAPILDRGSQWRPLLTGDRPELATPGAGTYAVYYTTGSNWCDQPQATDGQLLCPDLGWVEWPDGQTLGDQGVDPATITGLQVELLPTTPLQPAGTVDIDMAMTAPAYSPADTPNTTGSSGATTYAFNSVGTAARWVDGGPEDYTLSTEPPRVGVGLARGALQVAKLVTGDAADDYAPDSFPVTLSCTSAGVDVPLGDVGTLTLAPDTPITVYDLPVYAQCTLGEGDNGQTSFTSVPATVPPDGTAVLPVATLTNTYEFASLAVTKTVDSSAEDQDGEAVPYGPFTVSVACTFLDEAVYADGYDADNPMAAELSDGQTVTFTGLPAGADCAVTETDDKGAVVTTVTTQAGDGDPATTNGTTAPIELATGDTNTATVTNEFTVGSLDLEKVVTGSVAEAYGQGPFTLQVTCVLDDESGTRTVYDSSVTLGGAGPLTAQIPNLPTGAQCTVTEPGDGGASLVTISPTQPVTIGTAPDTVEVTVTNSFDPATVLVNKVVTGDAAYYAPETFQVTVTCSVDGEVLSGFPQTVEVAPGTPTQIQTLAGSTCSAVETDTGEATEVTYDPPNPDDPDSSANVNPGTEQPGVIAVTNEFRAGGLQIAKAIDGPGAALATRPFVFDVTCAFNGEPAAFTTTVTVTPDGTASSLTSDVIEPLPVGAVCTVAETDSGGADVTPQPVTVTIPDVDEDGAAQVVVAGFVNPFSAAQLQVTKVLAGDDATSHTSEVFTLAVTCQYELDQTLVTVYSGSVSVTGGQTVLVTDAAGNPVLLPPGAHCFAAETDDGGADASSVDYNSYDNAVIVTPGDELGTVTITAVNTFNAPPAPPGPPVYPPAPYPGGGGGSGSLSWTGFAAGQWLLIGFALFALGAGLVSVTRRRRAG